MAEWLTESQALALIALTPGDVDATAFGGALEAARDHVEGKRSDLFVPADPVTDPPAPPVFTPGGDVLLGTAMLAHRWYERRSSPLGAAEFSEFGAGTILRHDPDIAKLLGIGTEGAFLFGAGGDAGRSVYLP